MSEQAPVRTTADIAAVFAALGQETRLEAFRLLLRYSPFGLAAGDLARLLAVPHNTLSTHLSILQAAKLVRSRKVGRTVIYAAAPDNLAFAQAYLGEGTVAAKRKRRAAAAADYPTLKTEDDMGDKAYNVLILCTGNSARSILAEAIINREGKGRFHAFSAGSQPKGKPNPFGLKLLFDLGYDTAGLRSKSWEEFGGADAPKMDFIITVCDNAAGEACPYWPGHPLVAHWGIPDPADIDGTEDQKRAAFQEAYRRLMNRVTALINLPVEQLSLPELKAALMEIGRMEGATELARDGKAA
jgi:arsenate reductase